MLTRTSGNRESGLARLRGLIGGRWAISLTGYLLLAPISVVWIFTTVPEAFMRADGWLLGLLVAVTSYLVTGAILWLAARTVFKHRAIRPVPIVAVATVGALAWGARSGYLGLFLDVLDLPSQATPVTRIVTGSLLGAVIVPGTAWGLALLDDFRSTRARLLDEFVAQEMRAENSATYIYAMRQAVLSEVNDAVDREFQRVSDNDDELPAAVDQLAQRMARDLPRELWTYASEAATLTPALIMRTTARRPLAVGPAIPMALLGLLIVVRFLPWTTTVVSMGAAVLWTFAVVLVVNRWARRSRTLTPLVLGTLGVLASGVVFGAVLNVVSPASSGAVAFGVMVSATFAVFVVGGGLAHAVNVAEKSVLSALTESISQAEIQAATLDREEARLRREIATTLHGTVGANLTAASMRLRSAIFDGNTIVAVNALHEARQLVDQELSAIHLDAGADPAALIDHIAEAWTGLVTIRGEVSVTEPLEPVTMRALDDVITEGVNNAVRHARARNILIRVLANDTNVLVEIIDDGHRTPGPQPGLGSRILDQLAPGSWSLTASASGSTLAVELPAPARH